MYSIDKFYEGCKLVGEFIKNGKRYKIYRLPNNTFYLGFTLNQLFQIFDYL